MKLKRDLADDSDGLLVSTILCKEALGSLDPEYGIDAVQNFCKNTHIHLQENDQALRAIMDDKEDIAIWDLRMKTCQEMLGVIDRSLSIATSKAVPNYFKIIDAMAYICAVQAHAYLILMMNR